MSFSQPDEMSLCLVEFLFGLLATGTAPRVGQFLKRSAGRDVLLGVALFGVVGVLAGAFKLCHNRIFVLG